MNVEILSVGTELLLGEILNTDAKFMAEELSIIGMNVYYQTVVGDNRARLENALKIAMSRADIVIASGGLGPTPDDLTKEVIAEAMGEKLVCDKESLESMELYFSEQGREMPENNKKQAMLPENGIILKNNNGTAPGAIIEKDGKAVIMLPGPPSELEPMFRESVIPYLKEKSGSVLYSETLKIFGMGESKVAEILNDMMEKNTNPTVAPYAETAGVRLRITSSGKEISECRKAAEETKEKIKSLIGEYIYAEENISLAEAVVKKLIEKKLTIASAESCTGGMFAKMIVDVPGCSEILGESIVTYSNEAKMKYLGVKKETLEKFGAVSAETAKEMAEGIRAAAESDIGVSFTGIAGPDGGTAEKPVGLVYMAVAHSGGTEVKKLMIKGSRDKVRYVSCLNAFDSVRRKI